MTTIKYRIDNTLTTVVADTTPIESDIYHYIPEGRPVTYNSMNWNINYNRDGPLVYNGGFWWPGPAPLLELLNRS